MNLVVLRSWLSHKLILASKWLTKSGDVYDYLVLAGRSEKCFLEAEIEYLDEL